MNVRIGIFVAVFGATLVFLSREAWADRQFVGNPTCSLCNRTFKTDEAKTPFDRAAVNASQEFTGDGKKDGDKKDKKPAPIKLPDSLNPEAYENQQHKFTIHFPKGYKNFPGKSKGTVVLYRDPTGLANINIRSGPTNANDKVADVFAQIRKGLSGQLKNAKIHGEGDATIDSVPAKWLDVSHSGEGKNVRLLFYIVIKQQTFYMIFCTAQEDVFERHRQAFRDSAESLRVK